MSINAWETEGYIAVPLHDMTWERDSLFGYEILDPKIKQKADFLPYYENAAKNSKTCQKILKVAAIISLIVVVSAINLALIANPIGISLCAVIGAVFVAYLIAKGMESYYQEKALICRQAYEQKVLFDHKHQYQKA